MIYDAVVLGLGGMGSAALAHLAGRGAQVLGIEQFSRGHALGSSTGRTRIIRKAYFEDPAYVPLLERAYVLWHALEAQTGSRVLDLVGILMAGLPQSTGIAGTRASAHRFGLALEEYDAAGIARRFPGTTPLPDEVGLFERDAGIVFPEAAVAAHLALAEGAGAQTRFETTVTRYDSEGELLRIELADGSAVRTRRLAICAGPWLSQVARDLGLPLRVQRNVQVWFAPASAAFSRDRFPGFFLDRPAFPAPLYGFPDGGAGVKAALHAFGVTADPRTLDRDVHEADIAAVRDALESWMPGSAAGYLAGKVCMYTLTPDEHFIVDRHPHDARVVIAGGFSGHGFKFCPVIGEIVADLALEGATAHPIAFLRLDRFAASATAEPTSRG